MTWLDRAVSWVAPATGLRRLRARAAQDVLLSYEGARIGRRTSGWLATGASANAEIGTDLAKLRERSRELVRNNHFAAKAVLEWKTKIAGNGILPRSKVGTAALDRKVNELWEEFCENCSADGLPHFYALQSLAVASWFESGEVLVRFRTRRETDGLTVPLQLQLLESDFLDLGKTTSTATGYIIQGVEFDRLGRRLNYWLLPQHPGEVVLISSTRMNLQSAPVPADQVLHMYEMVRPGQVRGVPRLHASMLTMRDIDDWETAEIVRKKTEACLVAGVETTDESATISPTRTEAGKRIEKMSPGEILYFRLGEKVTFNSPQHAGGYGEYKASRVRDLGAGIGMPYEILSGDLSKVNYSSYRGGLIGFRGLIESAQYNVVIPQLCQPVWDKFIDSCVMAGLLPEGEYPVEWNPPAFDLLDRLQEAQADRAMVRLGTMTWPQAVARQGHDPDAQLAEIEAYNKKRDAADVVSDGDPRKVSDKGIEQPSTAAALPN